MTIGIFTDNKGSIEQVSVDMALCAEAKDAGAKHPLAHLDSKIIVAPGMPSPRQQIYAQLGLADKNTKLKAAMDGTALRLGQTGPTTAEATSITGRLAVQSYLFDAIENKLRASDYGIMGVFNSKAAQVDSVNATKFDRPIINMSRPEAGRSRSVVQLAEPASMMTLTISDTSFRIPNSSIGIEYSDQFAESTSLPIVTMSILRQAESEAIERVEGFLLGFLNGDVDIGQAALATVPGAVKNAKTDYDSSLTAGNLSQKAWVNFLFNGSRFRKIDTVITDLAGALAIENRAGRPTVQSDDGTSKRIDTSMTVLNPTWPDSVQIIISQDPNWPANTLCAFDSRYGYHVINSTVLSYEALTAYSLRRSTKLRFDSGSVAMRFFDDAWSVLTLS